VNIYLFDCDETMDFSPAGGPVTLAMVRELKAQGAVVGICGNWHWFCLSVPDWPALFSIIGPMGTDKPTMLAQIAQHIEAEQYVLVGNDHATEGAAYSSPDDAAAARAAGWRFICERAFAAGIR
jgi:hypothetical protein